MKKYCLLLLLMILVSPFLPAQPNTTKYPEPEFSKEVYYLKKDSINSLKRLEKSSTKMESKTKMGGFGGYEMAYELEGSRSEARLPVGSNLSFVFSTGATAKASSPERDSMMRANGMDPEMMKGMGGSIADMSDPSNAITLYKVESAKGKRKIMMQKAGGLGSKKPQSSDKYTFSVKTIREGYWELVIDKPLPKGEYAFSMLNTTAGNMDGSTVVFAFGID